MRVLAEPFDVTLRRIRRGRLDHKSTPALYTCGLCRRSFTMASWAIAHTYQHKRTLVLIGRWVPQGDK